MSGKPLVRSTRTQPDAPRKRLCSVTSRVGTDNGYISTLLLNAYPEALVTRTYTLLKSHRQVHWAGFGDLGVCAQLADAALSEDATDGKPGPNLGLGDI